MNPPGDLTNLGDIGRVSFTPKQILSPVVKKSSPGHPEGGGFCRVSISILHNLLHLMRPAALISIWKRLWTNFHKI